MTTKKRADANIRISAEARKKLRLAAIHKGITLKELVDQLAAKLAK